VTNPDNSKIAYSDLGGIFMGKNIKSDFHKHHLIAIIISYGEPFEITLENGRPELYEAVFIQKDTNYKLEAGDKDHVIFIHLDPYSEYGMQLSQQVYPIQRLEPGAFEDVLNDCLAWFRESENNIQRTEQLLNAIVSTVVSGTPKTREMDSRIVKCIQYIKQSDLEKIYIDQMAELVYLSSSRLSHLFKEETGITVRQFVLHCKLVKSLQAIYEQHNFTESSFMGGFSDQPHFTKTFKKAFGIKPSSSRK
jgi:AraC-like DNA-binding protein